MKTIESTSPGSQTLPVPNSRGLANASLVSAKVESRHLQRQALVYIRQSTPQQVAHNTESTERQYALRQ